MAIVEFFDEKRLLLKQELLEPEDEFSTISSAAFLKMPPTVLKAWWDIDIFFVSCDWLSACGLQYSDIVW